MSNEMRLCDVCNKPVSEWERHDYHEDDCPNFGGGVGWHGCECDLVAHPECCPQCKPPETTGTCHECGGQTVQIGPDKWQCGGCGR